MRGLSSGSFSNRRFNPGTTSDFSGLINTINGLPNRAPFYTHYDINGNGTITSGGAGRRAGVQQHGGQPARRGQLLAEPPDGRRPSGPAIRRSELLRAGSGLVRPLHLQPGLRAEQWKHFATTGANIFTFDWEFAPRLSAVYDLLGDGRQKAFAFYGRYYDPIRNNMTQFAGTLTGGRDRGAGVHRQPVGDLPHPRRLEQQDAFFAPTTQTPYTDDITVGYQADLGRNMSFETTYTNRRTRDILEDYDLTLYALSTTGTTSYPGNTIAPGSLWLGLDYFGYATNPGSNFVIGTLEGGKRDYHGVDLIFRKRYSDNWQALVSYTYNRRLRQHELGLERGLPGRRALSRSARAECLRRQPGNIPHIFKFAGPT